MKTVTIILVMIVAGRLFWLGINAIKLGSPSMGLPMIIGALWICASLDLKR